MAKFNRLLGSFVACAAMLGGISSPVSAADINIIPIPVKTQVQKGEFVLPQKVVIAYQTAEGRNIAQYMADKLKASTGYEVTVGGKKGNISIQISPSLKIAEEGYRLTVTAKGVVIKAKTAKGAFYGMQSFMQLLPAQIESATRVDGVKWVAQCCDIQDAPRFGYRGFHLDPCRHFISVENVKKQLDLMSMFKVNTMHFHLTEDQGWRIEIKKYPKLTSVGSIRTEGDGSLYGGFYTQEQIKEIVDYAAKRYITVIPEIDLPGHMMAAISAYPYLSCKGEQWSLRTVWGVEDIVMCPGKEDMFRFLDDIFSEIVPLFPGKYFHIGGDECPKTQWQKCPKCQARIKALHLEAKDGHTAEERLQSYVITHASNYLKSLGRNTIGWDEILEGGLAEGATVMSWRGETGGIAAAKQHHDVVMTPNSYLYFDYYQSLDKANEPEAIGGYLPLERVYSYEPMPKELTADEARHIIGVQANIWTEYMPTFKQMQYMALPRMAALSEVQWSQPELKNYADFTSRLVEFTHLYDHLGYNYAKHLFNVNIHVDADTKWQEIVVHLTTTGDAEIRYTLDGTEPTANSPLYTGAITLQKSANICTAAFRDGKRSSVSRQEINFNKATACPVTLLQPTHKSYTYNGAATLTDGLLGDTGFGTGRWLGFCENDLEAVIDMQRPSVISHVEFNTCVDKGSWILDARDIEVSVSQDGKTFKQVATKQLPTLGEDAADKVYTHKLDFQPTKARYVKVKATSERNMPEWHSGKGKPAFLFVDEISIM